jgi:hypothetical protein
MKAVVLDTNDDCTTICNLSDFDAGRLLQHELNA